MDLQAPPAHTAPANGLREESWAAAHTSTRTNSTQTPHMFSQTPALDAFMTSGSMPEADELMRATAEEMRRSNNTHSHTQHYWN